MPTAGEWKKLKPHPLSNELPAMTGEEFQALKQDIESNGLKEPILLFHGQILDGRHRHEACVELDSELDENKFEVFQGTEDEARKLIASANLMRRHLSKSQKAMFAVLTGLVTPPATKGKRRRYGTGRKHIMELGKSYGVNHVTMYKAAYVAKDKELAQRVMKGELSVARAEAILRRREVAQAMGNESVDAVGSPVPESLLGVFSARPCFAEIEDMLQKAQRQLETISKCGIPDHRLGRLRTRLEAARKAIADSKPHHVCAKCGGEGCRSCGTLGWIPGAS
jgi:hypothetical protein